MKTIFILMDSLNRNYLGAYGNKWVHTPNIDRLVQRSKVFDNHYCASMPCMPARRDIMTGRMNFMETPWGSMEPFDDPLPIELKQKKKVYSHLITDHYHYWEQSAHGYHTVFDTWEFIRGQEGDHIHPRVKDPEVPKFVGKNRRQDWINRSMMDLERDEDYPTPQCFIRAIDFLEKNQDQDNWHLHLEVFDPHEPFVSPSKYREMYQDKWNAAYHFDWPPYRKVEEGPEAIEHIQKSYAATLTMADVWLGKFLDKMDQYDLWKDTRVILTTDHGHLLGEHGYWAKNYMFVYEQLAHIPLIVCSPETAKSPGRITSLTSAIDLMPTIMDFYGAEIPPHVLGHSFAPLLESGATGVLHQIRNSVLYGYWGADINYCDGRHTYTRQAREGSVVYDHTAMPVRYFRGAREEFKNAECGRFLKDTYNMPVFRTTRKPWKHDQAPDFDLVYDILQDPNQESPLHDADLVKTLAFSMKTAMEENHAPENEFVRVGLG